MGVLSLLAWPCNSGPKPGLGTWRLLEGDLPAGRADGWFLVGTRKDRGIFAIAFPAEILEFTVMALLPPEAFHRHVPGALSRILTTSQRFAWSSVSKVAMLAAGLEDCFLSRVRKMRSGLTFLESCLDEAASPGLVSPTPQHTAMLSSALETSGSGFFLLLVHQSLSK